MNKIIFFGTPEFAVDSLDILVRHFDVCAVVTATDKSLGKHKYDIPVKRYALDHGIVVLQPEKLRNEVFLNTLKAYNADLFVVVAYRMLPECVWNMPKYGTINLHGSLLPKYRGAAPINWAIVNGESQTGVSTFFINNEIDAGQLIMQKTCEILLEDNFKTLYCKLKVIGANVLLESVNAIFSGNINHISQSESSVSLAPKITTELCMIDWHKPANYIHNFIRGMYPNAWTILNNGMRCKITKSHVVENANQMPPQNITSDKKKYLYIGTGNGVLAIDQLQPEGKKIMDIKAFLAGYASKLS